MFDSTRITQSGMRSNKKLNRNFQVSNVPDNKNCIRHIYGVFRNVGVPVKKGQKTSRIRDCFLP